MAGTKCVPPHMREHGCFKDWKGDGRFVFSPGFPLPWGAQEPGGDNLLAHAHVGHSFEVLRDQR